MLGTLVAALEVRGVPVGSDASVDVGGDLVLEDGIPVLRRIRLLYDLPIPEGYDDKVGRALATHANKCPTAKTLAGCVEISWSVKPRD
jgi:uncharacterized OsmC-like protein